MTNSLNVYQITLIILSLYFITRHTRRFLQKEQNQSINKIMMTYIIWGGVIIISLFPKDMNGIMMKLGLGKNYDGLIFLVFIMIFLILYKILNIIENIERNISEIVRKEALKDIKK